MKTPFRGFSAILYKEFIVVLRDPMTLFFMFFPPLIEMIAFGYALDNDVKHMAMAILNEDRTVESRQFLDRFVNTETFRIVGVLAPGFYFGRDRAGIDLLVPHPAPIRTYMVRLRDGVPPAAVAHHNFQRLGHGDAERGVESLERCGGVRAVDQHLDLRGMPGPQIAREVWWNL